MMILTRRCRLPCVVLRRAVGCWALTLLVGAATAWGAPTPLVTLPGPVGVAVGSDGSIFATYDQTTNVALIKLSPQGRVLAQVSFGGFLAVGEVGHLAIDPATGKVWDLFTTGQLVVFDPDTLASQTLGSLAATSLTTNDVFDVSQGRLRDMSGEIIPGLSSFGDIALLRRGASLSMFATGRSSSGVPYVARYDFTNTTATSARAVTAASISSEVDNSPRGVAVNQQGNVLTTLPTPDIRLNVQDRAYIFSSTFPESGSGPKLVFGGRDLASRGMTTDAAGNFYVTGYIGTTLCGVNAAGGITVISPDGLRGLCVPLSSTPVNTEDVAIGPQTSLEVYSTLSAYPGAILSWGQLPGPPSPVGTTGGNQPVQPPAAQPPRVACVVPRLTKLTLSQARRALKRAHCRLGTAHRPKHVRLHRVLLVRRQSARPRSRHPANFAVSITLK
jgi:hypothetical protein